MDQEQTILGEKDSPKNNLNEQYQRMAQRVNKISFDYDVLRDQLFFTTCHDDGQVTEHTFHRYLEELQVTRCVHPSTIREYHNALVGRGVGDSVEFLYRMEDGVYKWCRAIFRPVYDDTHHLVHMVGRVDEIHEEIKILSENQQDPVTGLFSRAAMEEHFKKILEDPYYIKQPKALFTFEIEGLSDVDDKIGIDMGDKVLKSVGYAIASAFHATDVVGRFEGNSLAALMADASNPQKITDVLNEVHETTQNISVALSAPIEVKVGVAVTPKDGTLMAELFACADESLHGLKKK